MASARLFINDKSVRKDGTSAIYARVHISSKTIKINTTVTALPDKFDTKKGRIKGNSQKVKDDNLIIDKCLSLINDIFVRYRLQQKALTADLLLREYKNPSLYLDFLGYMDKRLLSRMKGKEISPVSERHQRVTLNKLKEFKSELNFAEVDVRFITSFKNWLRTKKGNDVNTIQKTLSYFNIYMNLARREGIITSNPFDNMVFRRIEPKRVWLTEAELKKLILYYDANRYSDSLHKVLRHFLFMCLTGVRISDFIRLRRENIQDNALKFIPHKTKHKKRAELHIPLIDKARQLIRDEKSDYEELFLPIKEQKMNEALKTIADMSGIRKEISNHSARHTFATLFLEKTSDVATLQKMLGHTNIRETMIYVHISTKKITDQMKTFNRLFDV